MFSILLLIVPCFFTHKVRYDGHSVYRIYDPSVFLIDSLSSNRDTIVWSESKEFLDIQTDDPSLVLGLNSSVLIPNVQLLLDAEERHSAIHSGHLTSKLKSVFNLILDPKEIFSDYQDMETIYRFFEQMDGVRSFSLGKTYQERDIMAFQLGTGDAHIIIDSGIHAREWITPAVNTFVAYSLSNLANNTRLLNEFTFTFIPFLNPDGYEMTRTRNRMKRKNMQPNQGSKCVGEDINRNFPAHWGQIPGASKDPCSDSYYGAYPLSSKEAMHLSKFVKELNNVVSYINLHSYSQLFMFAPGYHKKDHIAEFDKVSEGAKRAVDAMYKSHKVTYKQGPIADTIYIASGTSVDYMYDLGIVYSYTIELRDKGFFGFMLPANQIKPCGEELFSGLMALWEYILFN